jgi:hypothetical protein
MLDNQTAQSLIKPHMPVVCSENGQFATVDHLEGRDEIKLTKDKTGQHHFIPLSWVSSVDDKVHVDRPGDQAMKEWKTAPKDGGQGQGQSQTSEHDESRGTNEKRDNKMDVGDKKPQKNQQNNSGNAPRSTHTNQNDNNTKR